MTGAFARWQPEYAAHGIALFPVAIKGRDKRPAVRNYLRIGSKGSRALASGGYAESTAFGFAAGERSGITILDVDSPAENDLADAMSRHGQSPLIVRTLSGHYQGWYRWTGERRRIRPMAGKPVDVLGGGFTVAPPSQGQGGKGYQIIAGSLDDLDRLPPLKAGGLGVPPPLEHLGEGSGRNDALYRLLGREVRACGDLPSLIDVANGINAGFGVPLPDNEVEKTAHSVWRMQAEGRNRFGCYGVWLPSNDLSKLMTILSPPALALFAFLRANNGPVSQFMVADGLSARSEFSSWSRRDIPNARKELIARGLIVPLSKSAPGQAATYAWGGFGKERSGEVLVKDSIPKLVGVCQKPQMPRDGDSGMAFASIGTVANSISGGGLAGGRTFGTGRGGYAMRRPVRALNENAGGI